MVTLAEYGGKLVHDATLHATVIVLSGLAHLCQCELVEFVVAEQVIQGVCIGAFQSCRWWHAGSQRNVSGKSRIESFHIDATLNHLAAYAKDVACPAGAWSVFLVQSKLHVIFQVDGVGAYLVGPIGFELCHHAFVDGSREYESAIVVGMLTDEVDTSGRGIQCSGSAVKVFDETASYMFDIHSMFKFSC